MTDPYDTSRYDPCPHCGKGWGSVLQACAVINGKGYHIACSTEIRNVTPSYFEPTSEQKKTPADLPVARATYKKK